MGIPSVVPYRQTLKLPGLDSEFEASPGYTVRLCLQKKKVGETNKLSPMDGGGVTQRVWYIPHTVSVLGASFRGCLCLALNRCDSEARIALVIP